MKGKTTVLEKQYENFLDLLLNLVFPSISSQIDFFFFIQEILFPLAKGKLKTKIVLILFKILKNEAKTLFDKSKKNPLTDKETMNFKKIESTCKIKLTLSEYDNLINMEFPATKNQKEFENSEIEQKFEIFYVLNSFHYYYDFLIDDIKPKEVKYFCRQNMLFLNDLLENLITNKILEKTYDFEIDGFFKTLLNFYIESSKNTFHPKLIFDYILKFNLLVPDLLFLKKQEINEYVYEKEFLRETKVFLYCKKNPKKITDRVIKKCFEENNIICYERLLVLNSNLLKDVWLDEKLFSHFLLTLENSDLNTFSKIQIILLYLNKVENLPKVDINSINFTRLINYILELHKNDHDNIEAFHKLFDFFSIRAMIKQNEFKSLKYTNPEQFIRKYFLFFIENQSFYYKNFEILLKNKKEKLLKVHGTNFSSTAIKIFPNFNLIKECLPVFTKVISEYFEFDEKSKKFTVKMKKISKIKDKYDFPNEIIDILNNMLDELIDNSDFIFVTLNYFKKYFPLVFLYYKDFQDEKLKRIFIKLFRDNPDNFIENHKFVNKFFSDLAYDENFKNNFCEFFIKKKIDYEKKSLTYVNQVLFTFISISPNEQQIFQILSWLDNYIKNFEDISKTLTINDLKLQSLEDEWECIIRKISELLKLKIKMKKEHYYKNNIFLKQDKLKIKQKLEKSFDKYRHFFDENTERDSKIYFNFNDFLKKEKKNAVNCEFEEFLKNNESEKKPSLQIFPILDSNIILDYISKNLVRNKKNERQIHKKNNLRKKFKSRNKKAKKEKDLLSNSDKWSSLDGESDDFDLEEDDNEIKIKAKKSDSMVPLPSDLFELFGETPTEYDEKKAKNEEIKNRDYSSEEEIKHQEYLSDSSKEESKEKETNENEKETINEENKCQEDSFEEEGGQQEYSFPSEEEKEEEIYNQEISSDDQTHSQTSELDLFFFDLTPNLKTQKKNFFVSREIHALSDNPQEIDKNSILVFNQIVPNLQKKLRIELDPDFLKSLQNVNEDIKENKVSQIEKKSSCSSYSTIRTVEDKEDSYSFEYPKRKKRNFKKINKNEHPKKIRNNNEKGTFLIKLKIYAEIYNEDFSLFDSLSKELFFYAIYNDSKKIGNYSNPITQIKILKFLKFIISDFPKNFEELYGVQINYVKKNSILNILSIFEKIIKKCSLKSLYFEKDPYSNIKWNFYPDKEEIKNLSIFETFLNFNETIKTWNYKSYQYDSYLNILENMVEKIGLEALILQKNEMFKDYLKLKFECTTVTNIILFDAIGDIDKIRDLYVNIIFKNIIEKDLKVFIEESNKIIEKIDGKEAFMINFINFFRHYKNKNIILLLENSKEALKFLMESVTNKMNESEESKFANFLNTNKFGLEIFQKMFRIMKKIVANEKDTLNFDEFISSSITFYPVFEIILSIFFDIYIFIYNNEKVEIEKRKPESKILERKKSLNEIENKKSYINFAYDNFMEMNDEVLEYFHRMINHFLKNGAHEEWQYLEILCKNPKFSNKLDLEMKLNYIR